MMPSLLTISQCLNLFLTFSLKFASGKPTEKLTDSHVIQAMKFHVNVGSTFPSVVDFFLDLQNDTRNETEHQAGNKPLPLKRMQMYEMARLINLGEKIILPSLLLDPSTTTMFDWLAEFTESDENSDQVGNKVLSLTRANHSVVDYYLRKPEKTTRDSAFTRFNVDKVLATMENIHLYYNISHLRNKDRILSQYIREQAYKQVTKPISISEILSSSAEIFTTIVDTEATASITTHTTTASTVEQVGFPINNTVNDIKEDINETHSNKFFQKIKKIFRNFRKSESTTHQEGSTQHQATLTTNSTKISRLKKIKDKILKSKVGKKCQRVVNNIAKLKKGILMILGVKQTTTEDGSYNKNNPNNISQGIPIRQRRDVSNFKGTNLNEMSDHTDDESFEKTSRKMGFFDKVKSFFKKNEHVNANTDENSRQNLDEDLETIRIETSLVTEDTTQSKCTNDPFTISKWLEKNNPSHEHLLDLSTGLYRTEFSILNMRTREQKFSDIFNITRKQDILLENAKKLLQSLCNTTKPISFTKIKDFIAGISTRSGQEWWEALSEHEDSEKITVPTVPDNLWKFFQKSLKVTTAEFSSVVTGPSLFPNNLKDFKTGSTPSREKRPPQKDKTKYKYENWRGISKEDVNLIKDVEAKPFEHCRWTTKIESRKKDGIQTSRNTTQSGDSWKFIVKGLKNATTRPTPTIFNLEGRTFYRTQSAVFTYKKKTSHTSQQSSKTTEDEVIFLTDDPKWHMNRTFDYEYFNELMRASLPPEYHVFFTDKFTTPQPTIKKSMFQMIKNIFRGGKSSAEVKQNKTESEEDFEHYKYLCDTYDKRGNITKEEFEKRKLGDIQVKWS